MHRTLAIALVAVLLPACGSGDDAPAKRAAARDQALAPQHDAGVDGDAAPIAPHSPEMVEYDTPRPLLGDPNGPAYRPPTVRARTVELTLRSSPPGAVAAVDGKRIGPTPTFWRGKVNGKPREFTFVLPGYAMARYRFVPTTNGIVHASLKPLTSDEPDAGPPAE